MMREVPVHVVTSLDLKSAGSWTSQVQCCAQAWAQRKGRGGAPPRRVNMDVDDDDLLRDDDLDVRKQESSSPDGSQESESRKPAKKRKRGKSSAKKKKAVSEDISSGRKHVKSRRSTATGKRHAASSSAKAQAKAKTKAKAKAAAAKGQQAGQEDPSQSYDGWKKCGLCRKWLQHDSFNQDQSKCKDCNNGTRQFNRMVEKQECGDKIKKLSAKDGLAVVVQWFGQRASRMCAVSVLGTWEANKQTIIHYTTVTTVREQPACV